MVERLFIVKHNTLVNFNIKILLNRQLCYTKRIPEKDISIYRKLEENIFRVRREKFSRIADSLFRYEYNFFRIKQNFERLLDD